MKLTNITIKTAKPKAKPYKLFDGGGLFLLINPNGSKYWRLKYRVSGKEKLLAIGVYPIISLSDARNAREQAKKQLHNKLDPSQQRQIAKSANEEKNRNAFEKIAREWHKKQSKKWKPKHIQQVIKSLENDIFPAFGSRAIADIDTATVLEALEVIEARGAHEIALRVRQRVSSIFVYAIAKRLRKDNPAAGLEAVLTPPPKRHHAALSLEELKQFLIKLQSYDGREQNKLALELIVHTFVRTSELRFAKWAEIDFSNALWTIPSERMKNNKEHLVPLSKQSLAILKQLHELTGKLEWLLPSDRTIKKPISENTLLYAMYRLGYKGRTTVHGFRSTASTALNESNLFSPDAIERQLSHVPKNETRAAYNRAKYLEERIKMMQWWAEKIDNL